MAVSAAVRRRLRYSQMAFACMGARWQERIGVLGVRAPAIPYAAPCVGADDVYRTVCLATSNACGEQRDRVVDWNRYIRPCKWQLRMQGYLEACSRERAVCHVFYVRACACSKGRYQAPMEGTVSPRWAGRDFARP